MVLSIEAWGSKLDELIALYRTIELRSLSLPSVSLRPLGIFFWNYLKAWIALLLDFLLIVPINLVIFLRNLLPGRWRHRSFSREYLRYAWHWLWRGEGPVAMVVVRRFTSALLFMHFRNRLNLLRRRILLENHLPAEKRRELLSNVDQALEQWHGSGILPAMFTYAIPAAGFVLQIFQALSPGGLPVWTRTVAPVVLTYSISLVASAFVVKRGLMLGGEVRSAYLPGALHGAGAYEEEARILESVGISAREFPLDIVLNVIGVSLALLTPRIEQFNRLFGPPPPPGVEQWTQYSLALITLLLAVLALGRRQRLGRR